MKKIFLFCCMALSIVACKHEPKEVIVTKEIKPGDTPDNDGNIKIVDQFYAALTGRDSAGVLSLMAPNAKLYGSDPLEDWNLDQIKTYMSDRSRDTTVKAVFTVKKRDVRMLNEFMYVTDIIDISTIHVPFRVVTITEKKDGVQKIVFSEFSALVRNDDIRAVESLFDKSAAK
ncbi:MAG: nuclear transport factor 2 family protein [Bacteroidia bacterium]